jgi:hypothetical protein
MPGGHEADTQHEPGTRRRSVDDHALHATNSRSHGVGDAETMCGIAAKRVQFQATSSSAAAPA